MQAEALVVEHPVRTALTEAEIKAISEDFYAQELGADEDLRKEGVMSARKAWTVCANAPPICRDGFIITTGAALMAVSNQSRQSAASV